MIKINDEEARVMILDKLTNNINPMLPIEDDVTGYMAKPHYNYIVEGKRGLFCYTVEKKYITVYYVWSDMSVRAHKELIKFAKMLYKRYTIDNNLPILYTGLKNFYPNHSVELADKLWQFEPKDF